MIRKSLDLSKIRILGAVRTARPIHTLGNSNPSYYQPCNTPTIIPDEDSLARFIENHIEEEWRYTGKTITRKKVEDRVQEIINYLIDAGFRLSFWRGQVSIISRSPLRIRFEPQDYE